MANRWGSSNSADITVNDANSTGRIVQRGCSDDDLSATVDGCDLIAQSSGVYCDVVAVIEWLGYVLVN